MKFGAMYFATGSGDVAETASAIEALGFESLFVPEHSHVPARSPSWSTEPVPLFDDYKRIPDPFVTLSIAAGATTELRLGTAICLAAEHDPIMLGNAVSSLDALSRGRVAALGVGAGHGVSPYLEAMRNHRVDPSQRWQVLREHVLALRELWSAEEPEFHGRFVDFDPLWSYPKPEQKPHPPILLGSSGRRGSPQWHRMVDRMAEYCDGWLPALGMLQPDGHYMEIEPADLVIDRWGDLRAAFAERGRPAPEVTLLGLPLDHRVLDRLAASGIDRGLFWIRPPVDAPGAWLDDSQLVAVLERCAAFVPAR